MSNNCQAVNNAWQSNDLSVCYDGNEQTVESYRYAV